VRPEGLGELIKIVQGNYIYIYIHSENSIHVFVRGPEKITIDTGDYIK
jgi:hypothetical protein